jgi:hypothetical protein
MNEDADQEFTTMADTIAEFVNIISKNVYGNVPAAILQQDTDHAAIED